MTQIRNDLLNEDSLSEKDISLFNKDGYLIMEGFLNELYRAELIESYDQNIKNWKAQGIKDWEYRYHFFEDETIGQLASLPALMSKIYSLMGQQLFSMHHYHAVKQLDGAPSAFWHQDYEQIPQSNRSHKMLHVFFYLNGLNGEIGDLMLLPGSQNLILNNNAMNYFGDAELPGCVVVDSLKPGSIVIVNSALVHARKSKPASKDATRYFFDISYCQQGVKWPRTKRLDITIDHALKYNAHRNGKYAFLFEKEHFFDPGLFKEEYNEINEGSLMLKALPSQKK